MWGVVLKTGLHNLIQMICTLSVHSFGCSSGSAWAANVHAASARVSWPNRLGSHRQVPSVLEYSAWLVFVVQGWKLAAFWCATLVLRKGWSPYRRGPADVRPRGTSRAAVRKAPPAVQLCLWWAETWGLGGEGGCPKLCTQNVPVPHWGSTDTAQGVLLRVEAFLHCWSHRI